MTIYRACLFIFLATVSYVWPIAGALILGWWWFALIGFVAKNSFPSLPERSIYEDMISPNLGPLGAWLCVWNGFYVWKDLDPDYWSKSRDK